MAVKQAFTADISAFVAKAGAKADQVASAIMLEITKRVVARTPVDTGRAKGGWNLAMEGNGGAVLSNNVPYIVALEYGHSKQAPAGMVRPTLAEFSAIVTVATSTVDKTPATPGVSISTGIGARSERSPTASVPDHPN